MTEKERITITRRIKKASLGMGVFWLVIFFPMSMYLRDSSFSSALIGSLMGSVVGSYLYFLIVKKSTFLMVEEIEKGLKHTVIPDLKFETFVEIGEFLSKKGGKIFITGDSLVFKPHRFNQSANQPFDRIFIKDISSVSIQGSLFGNEKIRFSANQKQYLITPFEDCSEVLKHLKTA